MSVERTAPRALPVAFAMATRTILLVSLFVAVAALLGPTEFGTFSAVLAVCGLASPLCGIGIGMGLVQTVSSGRLPAAPAAGNALRAAALSGLAVSLPLGAALLLFLPEAGWILVAGVVAADLVFMPVVEVSGRAFQAVGRPLLLPGLSAAMIALRLAILGAWWLVADGARLTAETWALLYAGASAIAAITAVVALGQALGSLRPAGSLASAVAGGAPMGLTWMAARANADADKALLARLADSSTAGWYTAAYRIVDLAVVPVQALLETSLPRFFASRDREAQSREFRVALRWILAIGAGGAVVLLGAAALLPAVLGPSYAQAVVMAQALCALPALSGLRLLLRQTLLGRGYTRLYPSLEAVGAATNVGLNLVLIPGIGWLGAVVSSYASEALMAILSAVALIRRRVSNRAPE